jgi:uncharacterized protein (TIGR00730 family)
MGKKVITIFGTSRASTSDAVYSLAWQIGEGLTEAGFTIANGGYGGTMLASAKGAIKAGGEVIGVTCSAFKSSRANEFVSREIVTASLAERLETLVNLGEGYVVLPGGTGTLLELAMVWELKNKGCSGSDKPIILVGEYWRPAVELMMVDDAGAGKCVRLAANAAEAKDYLVERFLR